MKNYVNTHLIVALLLVLTGCGGSIPKKTAANGHAGDNQAGKENVKSEHGGAGHSHESAHGGIVNTVGDFHVELVFDEKQSKLTAYISGEDGKTPKHIDAKDIPAQIKAEKTDQFTSIALLPAPMKGEKEGSASRFEASAAFTHAVAHEVFLRISVEGKHYRTAFQLTPGKAALGKTFICPMKCEKEKVYPQLGKCPVCKMNLVEFKAGQVEHSDHNPKHGGTFFMAADNWHHLEGVMSSPTEFRLYLFDNFTKPISAKGYEGTAEVVREDGKGDDVGKPVTLPLKQSGDQSYLSCTVPSEYVLPVAFTVRVTLRKGEAPALFNFTFDSVSKADLKK